VESFTDNCVQIHLSSGPTYPPIALSVREFRPFKEDFLAVHRNIPDSSNIEEEQIFSFINRYSLPLALPATEVTALRKKCLHHIKAVISQDRNPGETGPGGMSFISWKVFAAIERYKRASKAHCEVGY
jgi:hypothetical protein